MFFEKQLWKHCITNHKKCFKSLALIFPVFISKGKIANSENIYMLIYVYEKNFHPAIPPVAPAALPITAWAAVEIPAAPADCKAEKTPVVAPPYTAD